MNSPSQTPYNQAPAWPFALRVIFWIIWMGIGVLLLLMARPLWPLLILTLILGYLIQPLIVALTRLRISRGAATSLSVLVLILLAVLLPLILIPAILQNLAVISIDIPTLVDNVILWINHLPETLPGFGIVGITVDLTPFYEEISKSLSETAAQAVTPSAEDLINILPGVMRSALGALGTATTIATSIIGGVFGILLSGFLLLLLTFYFAYDQPNLVDYLVELAPDAYQAEWRELWRRTGFIWSSFFRGQLALSLIMGALVWLGLTIIGVPGAFALGALSAVLEVIPTLGPILAAVPGVALALLSGSMHFPEMANWIVALVTVGFYVLIQQAENLFLVPRILGRSVGIHPALVLVGVMIFASQFGIVGAFIATPVLATLFEWFKYFHTRILGKEPYPELAVEEDAGENAAQEVEMNAEKMGDDGREGASSAAEVDTRADAVVK
ncbi:MAG: AI-2E family transporter [Chloroflexi bacterium]|nr:AI-2E family transporter [Chloroflexota bacterium]